MDSGTEEKVSRDLFDRQRVTLSVTTIPLSDGDLRAFINVFVDGELAGKVAVMSARAVFVERFLAGEPLSNFYGPSGLTAADL